MASALLDRPPASLAAGPPAAAAAAPADPAREALRRFGLAFEPDVFRAALAAAHPGQTAEGPSDLALLYFSTPQYGRLDANALFDEGWYRRTYPDVAEAIAQGRVHSGLLHWLALGAQEGRFPCYAAKALADMRGEPGPEPDPLGFDAESYLDAHPQARLYLRHFPHLDAFGYAAGLGRWLEAQAPAPIIIAPPPAAAPAAPLPAEAPLMTPVLALLRSEFDEDWYFGRYLKADTGRWIDPWSDYVRDGMRAGRSPHAGFDESFYLAFNVDVREAVAAGQLACGFHHYMMTGREEGRAPRFQLQTALEAAIPGVTSAALMERGRALRERLAPMASRVAAGGARTLWVVVPRLNPDISFGGYRALFELVDAVRPWAEQRGLRLAVLVLEEQRANLDYFLWRTASPRLRRAFLGLEVRTRFEVDRLDIGPRDRFLAYSSWDVIFSAPLAARTDEPRVISLVQEYEPIFHDYGAVRAVSDWAFQLPSYPIFNSAALRDFFAAEKLGIFHTNAGAEPGTDYAVFEHVVHRLHRQTAAEMRARTTRQCAVYARPEGHAARNLYELVEIALRDLCGRGRFDARWTFTGLGCLAPTPPVELGGGHRLVFAPKMDERAYGALVNQLDLGISLMYAPHPSVMPFEFATTGAMVVTNTFSNRPPGWFSGVSRNIVAGAPCVPGIIGAIETALDRMDDVESRAAAAFDPPAQDWPQVFDAAFLEEVFGRLI